MSIKVAKSILIFFVLRFYSIVVKDIIISNINKNNDNKNREINFLRGGIASIKINKKFSLLRYNRINYRNYR